MVFMVCIPVAAWIFYAYAYLKLHFYIRNHGDYDKLLTSSINLISNIHFFNPQIIDWAITKLQASQIKDRTPLKKKNKKTGDL